LLLNVAITSCVEDSSCTIARPIPRLPPVTNAIGLGKFVLY
jgi:hypothetical protein